MLKLKDFVFALLTLICVSPVAGEEKTIYPKANEWPKFAWLEWGISEDEFFEACAKKGLIRDVSNDAQRSKHFPERAKTYVARGVLLGKKVTIDPLFEKKEGNPQRGVGLCELWFKFSVEDESRRDFANKLKKMLTDKYGPSSRHERHGYCWGAPHKPHIQCLNWDYWPSDLIRDGNGYLKKKEGPTKWTFSLIYMSKKRVDYLDEIWKKRAAEKRESEKKAKEDEKDF